jgi:hypothetical protein
MDRRGGHEPPKNGDIKSPGSADKFTQPAQAWLRAGTLNFGRLDRIRISR